MSEWRPIEEAPKDGTRVDVWVVGYSDEPKRIVNAWFDGRAWWYSDGEEVWPIDADNSLTTPARVTHWMPLPPAPAIAIDARNDETRSGSA